MCELHWFYSKERVSLRCACIVEAEVFSAASGLANWWLEVCKAVFPYVSALRCDSDLTFSRVLLSAVMMASFSARHKLHRLVSDEYSFAL